MVKRIEEDDHDDSQHRDAEPGEDPPKPPLSLGQRQRIADTLLQRLSVIEDPEQKDWYQALFSVGLDDNNGDVDKAMQQANENFNETPNPPQ